MSGRFVFGFFYHGLDIRSQQAATRLRREFADDRDVVLGGGPIANQEINATVRSDLERAELIALPLVLLLSLLVFRGLVAALLPPLVGLVAIGATLLGLRAVVEVTDVSVFALNLVTGLGFGLAIDYTLLLVSRYREELDPNRTRPGGARARRSRPRDGRSSSARSPLPRRWDRSPSSRCGSCPRWRSGGARGRLGRGRVARRAARTARRPRAARERARAASLAARALRRRLGEVRPRGDAAACPRRGDERGPARRARPCRLSAFASRVSTRTHCRSRPAHDRSRTSSRPAVCAAPPHRSTSSCAARRARRRWPGSARCPASPA